MRLMVNPSNRNITAINGGRAEARTLKEHSQDRSCEIAGRGALCGNTLPHNNNRLSTMHNSVE